MTAPGLFPDKLVPRAPGRRPRTPKPPTEAAAEPWAPGPDGSEWVVKDGQFDLANAKEPVRRRLELLNTARTAVGARVVHRNGRPYGIAVPVAAGGHSVVPMDWKREEWHAPEGDLRPKTKVLDEDYSALFTLGGQP